MARSAAWRRARLLPGPGLASAASIGDGAAIGWRRRGRHLRRRLQARRRAGGPQERLSRHRFDAHPFHHRQPRRHEDDDHASGKHLARPTQRRAAPGGRHRARHDPRRGRPRRRRRHPGRSAARTGDPVSGTSAVPVVHGRVRTRIAPSPTGFLHLGTARTALFSWAFARHHGGEFVLRIEDTDVARSTQEAVGQILESMRWLGLDHDEGPIYQMQRLDRYREVTERMLGEGSAYRCYATPDELEAMREAQRARGEKTLYDGRWRPEPGKTLPPIPEGVAPVIRFHNPPDGVVSWDDLVKGPITISNREIDDLVIVRADGVPTYNFAVVVDDWDMRISHVFRGDEHVNNTPWQINMFHALGAPLPVFAHVPIILGDDGQKLSKRRGAVSVTAYEEEGFLPEAMLNYLARLGWSHGDEELFTREQMIAWFDGSHLAKHPTQWDGAKLAWVNAHYLKGLRDDSLLALAKAQ